jgi:hypothetical protein
MFGFDLERAAWRRLFGFAATLLLFTWIPAACGSGGGGGAEATDTLSRRQKDSILSTMPVPGAAAVGKALRAADSANARAQRHDSLIK